MADMPSLNAQVVIIGGGIVGCSALYHLAKSGWTDLVLLEKNELTSGSTWHAAGNCPNFAGSWGVMKMQAYSNRLYQRLDEEVDYPINYQRHRRAPTGAHRRAHAGIRACPVDGPAPGHRDGDGLPRRHGAPVPGTEHP